MKTIDLIILACIDWISTVFVRILATVVTLPMQNSNFYYTNSFIPKIESKLIYPRAMGESMFVLEQLLYIINQFNFEFSNAKKKQSFVHPFT